MVAADLTLIKPIFHSAKMTINLYLGQSGNSSFMTFYEIYVGDELCVSGHVKLVWFDYEQHKSVTFTDVLHNLF